MTPNNLKKISTINDELDIKLLLYITKKNILFLIVFIIVAIGGAYIYLRYTHPLYKTSAIIQISTEDQTRSILPAKAIFDEDIAKQIELMRSQVFIERALEKLPLEIGYFSKGRVLNYELYRSTPFRANVNVKNQSIYGVPVYVDFIDNKNCIISYSTGNNNYKKKKIENGQTVILPEFNLNIEIIDFEAIDEQQSLISKNSYFFIINNPNNIAKQYADNLEISLLSAAAKTIQISFTGHNPRKASDIVNAVAEEFGVYELEKKTESANNILVFIDSQIDLIFYKLTESEMKLESFKEEHRINDMGPSPLPSIQDRISDFENRIIQFEMEENIYNEIEKSLREEDQTDVYKLVAILSGSRFHGNIAGMLTTLQELLLEREKLLYEVTLSSRQISSLDHQIDIQKKMIIESIGSLKNNIRAQKEDLNDKIKQYEQYLLSHRGDYSLVEFSRLQRVHSINERYYNQLVEKKAEYSISKSGFVSQSVILEKSSTPNKPVSPKSRRVYLSSVMAAMFMGIGIILLKYLFYNEISSLNDITKYTNAPVLGIIPKYNKEIPLSQILVSQKPKSLIAEALRSVRTNLQFISNEPGSKLIAVTSTISGEGKTFFSMNMAAILAFSNKKVIIIDLDMRKPRLHHGFGVDNTKGISTILSGIDETKNCIRKSKIEHLDFITAGPVPPNPSELVINEYMDNLIELLKKEYDYVFIDTPPVGIVTDGMKCLTIADYPVYIFRANYSKRMFVQNLNRLIFDNKISNLSLVLNAVENKFSNYGYGKIYSYGNYGSLVSNHGYYEEDDMQENKGIKTLFNFFLRKKS